jgi:hypothetical protein
LSIQETPVDELAALRVFAKIDDFMAIVAAKMNLVLDTKCYPYAAPVRPVGPPQAKKWMLEREAKMKASAATVLPTPSPRTSRATASTSPAKRRQHLL